MNEFDATDIIYNAISVAGTGVVIYKDKSEDGVNGEHIVINNLGLVESDFINKVPININIFIPLEDNGMEKRSRIRGVRDMLRKSLDSINSNDGYCKEVTVLWSKPIPELKKGFSCTNIRLEILIDK